MDYLSYCEAWRYAELRELNPDIYLENTLWRSMLTEEEIKKVVEFIQALYETKTFADFLKVVEWSPENFAYVFGRETSEVQHWMRKDNVFPVRLKQSYGFMLLTYRIAYGRQRICSCCGEAFLSMKEAIYCDRCHKVIQKTQENPEKTNEEPNKIKLQIELICKTS